MENDVLMLEDAADKIRKAIVEAAKGVRQIDVTDVARADVVYGGVSFPFKTYGLSYHLDVAFTADEGTRHMAHALAQAVTLGIQENPGCALVWRQHVRVYDEAASEGQPARRIASFRMAMVPLSLIHPPKEF